MKPKSIEEWNILFERTRQDIQVPLAQLENEWDIVAQACIDRRWGECKRCWALDPSCQKSGDCKRAQQGPRNRAIKSMPLCVDMLNSLWVPQSPNSWMKRKTRFLCCSRSHCLNPSVF